MKYHFHHLRTTGFGVALALLAMPLLATGPTPKPAPLPRDSVYQLPLVLTDQSGHAGNWAARRGRTQLVSMFYTSCRYTCPLIVDSGLAIQRGLAPAQRDRLDVLLVSMDPANDTPKALMSVVTSRHLDTRRWTLASPPAASVRAAAGVLGIHYRQLADGDFNHTSALILLDPDGRILARTERIGSRPDPEFLAAVRKATSP